MTSPHADAAEALKSAFRRYPTGISLVTALTSTGPVGLTLSSLASLSVDPPAVSFSVVQGPSSQLLLGADSVSLHVLPASRRDLAETFARRGAERFTAEQGWTWRDGEPFLADAIATLTGTVAGSLSVGSSTLIAVSLDRIELGPDAAPLLHLDRRYRVLSDEPSDVSPPAPGP